MTSVFKKATTKIGEAQKKIDAASSRGYTTRDILRCDHNECPCFDEGNLTKRKNRGTVAFRTTSLYSRVPI